MKLGPVRAHRRILSHHMCGYYADKLSAGRLRLCYDLATPAISSYLEAEIDFVLDKIPPGGLVLELGCGYGRVLGRLAAKAGHAAGIDNSWDSLKMAREYLGGTGDLMLCLMDAADLGFSGGCFDIVACVQNGISAFRADRKRLVEEAVRVAAPGGRVLFSSYSCGFWEHRLEWFEIQSRHGLIGEIDHDETGNGVIVCRDGFRAETVGPGEFRSISKELGLDSVITEVDGSSVFCEILAR